MENVPQQLEPPRGPNLSPEKVQFYEQRAKELFEKHGKSFDKFVEGQKDLVSRGDSLLRTIEGSAYNILLSQQDMNLTSGRDLIFYNNYIRRTWHFGLLLAAMEQEKVITPDQVRFGVKASKTRFDEKKGWKPDPDDEEVVDMQFIDKNGDAFNDKVDKSVEIVITFSPADDVSALKIARFLLKRTDARIEGAIEGSWDIPDIRATTSLKDVLMEQKIGFAEAQANIVDKDRAQLVLLREKTKFSEEFPGTGWTSVETEMNEELAEYLTYFEVAS